MHAVILTAGKQFRVTEGQILKIPFQADKNADDKMVFEQVLLVGEGEQVKLGQPEVAGAKVEASVLEQGRDKKINIIKFKRRKHHLKRQGHRQRYTAVKIEKITA